MPGPRLLAFACAALIGVADAALAAPGDVVVPAHRSRDGTWIPANVPPSSGGTAIPVVPRLGKTAPRVARPTSRGRGAAPAVPLFVQAPPIRH